VKRTTTERVLLGILALGVWVLAFSALPPAYFLLVIVHRTSGGEYDDLVLVAHLIGVVLLLLSAGLSWGAYALSRKALGS